MNISPWLVYMFIKLDSIVGMAIAASVILGMGALLVGLIYGMVYDTTNGATLPLWSKRFKTCIVWCIICAFFACIIPTTKEMAVIYVVPKIANSEFINETLPTEMGEIYNMAKDWMKDTLKPDAKETTEATKVEKTKK